MKIVKCSKCGKYIHKATKCFHCGNTVGFDEIDEVEVHENIAQDYIRMEKLVEDKKYDEAIALSYTVLEWMPHLAGVFWLRLLAKNRCSTVIDLISRGFSCDEDSDFCNALDFSTGKEHSAYEDIQKTISDIRSSLKKEVFKHEYKCKSDTNIMQIKKTMKDEINSRKQKLFSLWSDLEDTEHSLYELELDCRLLTKEHQIALEGAARVASVLKSEADRLAECRAEKIYSFQVMLDAALQRSESSKNSIESMKKQHQWVKAFADLVFQRNQKVKPISSEIASLASYEQTVQQTILEIECIESRHKTAMDAADKCDFTDAAVLLGTDTFNQILRNVGVDVEFSADITRLDKRSVIVANTEQFTVVEDEMGREDYYTVREPRED